MKWQELTPNDAPMRIAVVGKGSDAELILKAVAAYPDAHVTAVECRDEEFGDCIRGLQSAGFTGAAICNPYKADAAKLATDFFRVRHALGVANALQFSTNIYAQNTEVPAFTSKVKDLEPGTALVLGSGRAARSAVQSLFDCGWKVRLWNRNLAQSKPFLALFEYYGKVETVSKADPTGCSLIVNATVLGAKMGEEPPVIWQNSRPRSRAIDFVYRNVATEFLRKATGRGFTAIDGRELLAEQAALSLEWWGGKPVDRAPILNAVGLKPSSPTTDKP